jgi:hypothetical protein
VLGMYVTISDMVEDRENPTEEFTRVKVELGRTEITVDSRLRVEAKDIGMVEVGINVENMEDDAFTGIVEVGGMENVTFSEADVWMVTLVDSMMDEISSRDGVAEMVIALVKDGENDSGIVGLIGLVKIVRLRVSVGSIVVTGVLRIEDTVHVDVILETSADVELGLKNCEDI